MAAAAAFSCLLQLILVSHAAAASVSRLHERQLQVLSEVVSGPARRRPLALHLDTALPADMQQAVAGMEALRRTPHLILILSFNHSRQWTSQEAAAVTFSRSFSSSYFLLHVVLWLTPQPELLQALWLHWKPRNLLLFNLESSPGVDVLLDETLSSVENLALFENLSVKADQTPDTLWVYTVLPFSNSMQLLGPWRSESFSNWEALFPDRFPSFEGYTFEVASFFRSPPYLYSSASAPEVPKGIYLRIIEAISTNLNYSYTLTPHSPDWKWGVIENGKWVGVLGMVKRKEKNFTINGFYISKDRIGAFDPSEMVGRARGSVFVPSPKPLPEWLSIIRPFSPSVWASFMAVVAVAVFSMAILERAIGERRRGLSSAEGAAAWQDLPRALVTQSLPTLPEALWQRVFVAVWLLGCLVATAAYTCNLVGIFTSVTYPRRLRTLQNLADSDYRVALLNDGGFLGQVVLSTRGPVMDQLRPRIDFFDNLDEALTALQEGRHAFIANEIATVLAIMQKMNDDEWYLINERFFSGILVWYFPKNKPWKKKIDENIRKLNYFGLIDHWFKVEFAEWVKENVVRKERRDSGNEGPAPPLTLRHLQGVFYILGLAWMASGTVLLLELLTYRHQAR